VRAVTTGLKTLSCHAGAASQVQTTLEAIGIGGILAVADGLDWEMTRRPVYLSSIALSMEM